MATQREEIVVRAGFDNTALASGLRTAGQTVTDWATHMAKTLGALFAAEKIFEFEKGLAELATNISLTAERLNVTTDEVQRLQYAAAMTGVELDTVANALDKLARAKEKILNKDKGAEQLLDSFKRFGLTIKDIEAMRPEELFGAISDSVAKTGANAEVTSDAMELFGRSAGKLIPVLKEFREQSEKAPIISDEDLQNIRMAGDELTGLKMKLEAVLATMQVRLFEKKTWQEFWYGITHPLANTDDISAMFNDPNGMGDPAKKAAYLKAHPESNPAVPQGTFPDDSDMGSGSSGGSGGSSKEAADLYRRRAFLAREINKIGEHSRSEIRDFGDELNKINDALAVKNAPNEEARLQVERGQAARDLRIEQSRLPIGDAARKAEINKVQALADKLKGIDDMIADSHKSAIEKLADHAVKQTTAMEKIAGAVEGAAMTVKIPSN